MNSVESRNPPSSSDGKRIEETMSSFRSSLSHAIHPVSSKTWLLLTRGKRRAASLDSNTYKSSVDDTFGSWDISSVDAHNRQTVLEASSPPHPKTHYLETILASPVVSRNPSPASTSDLKTPLMEQHSPRSDSHAPRRREQPACTQYSSSMDSHIHPLFRSDSPTPPPVAIPGSSVVASPNAGQVISRRQSIRSLNRMPSGSLPTPPSPLSGSFEDASSKKQRDEQDSIEEVGEEQEAETKRQMTPPIPEWILRAGTRTSMAGYISRKLKVEGDEAQQN
ncbi:hypothetical protein EDB81DRAFT_309751 [Dactylonectria macrodidyma]|uniref:Uncharacterized protein n=1 Tax=Dactylonectria macrodidyma TaxID=307937 RepID=A0A9P9D6T0_9HYPO|nr:hypothetical protein EDB81DRAFT_309751 [Dactylonectria macrodidyma]